MAGIGWKLQRLIDRDTLAGQVAAYMTGVAVTSAPWLLTTAVLVVLRLTTAVDEPGRAVVERLVTASYAVTLVLCAPVHVVTSRFAADRLYDRRIEGIAAPLRRTLAATLIGGALAGGALVLALGVTGPLATIGVGLTVVVAAQWLLLSVGGGLCSPGVVLKAYGLGAPISVAAAIALDRAAGLGAPGYLGGFAGGQLVALALLARGTFRALPAAEDEASRILPAFREYWLLALAALIYHAAIWIDKLAVWFVDGAGPARTYTTAAAFAWFSVIPAFAWIYVQIETVFYERYRAFFGGLDGGATLDELRQSSAAIAAEGRRIVRGAALIQSAVTLAALGLAPALAARARLEPDAVAALRWLLVGSALQVVALLGLLLLSYFDHRRDAVAISVVLLVGNGAMPVVAGRVGVSPAVGFVVACLIAAALVLVVVRRRLDTLLLDTFQSQPFR